MKDYSFTSKEIRFSGDSKKSCICFVDLIDSTKNTITMDNLEHIRIYYSKFINFNIENSEKLWWKSYQKYW
jgi:hypothetical protein